VNEREMRVGNFVYVKHNYQTSFIIIHNLPASRGENVIDKIKVDSHCALFDEVKNCLHAQKGMMAFLCR
jgi:ornithine carbamoyltransferase